MTVKRFGSNISCYSFLWVAAAHVMPSSAIAALTNTRQSRIRHTFGERRV